MPHAVAMARATLGLCCVAGRDAGTDSDAWGAGASVLVVIGISLRKGKSRENSESVGVRQMGQHHFISKEYSGTRALQKLARDSAAGSTDFFQHSGPRCGE